MIPFNIFTFLIESYGKGSVQSKEGIDFVSRKYSTLHLDKASSKPSYVPLEYGGHKGMIPDSSALVSSELQLLVPTEAEGCNDDTMH